MYKMITAVESGSPADKAGIKPGDTIVRVNGNVIRDILDYEYFTYDNDILLEISSGTGIIKLVRLRKPDGDDLGLRFSTQLLDKEQSCRNKCIFCFIDQLPKGMRETLYHKDDDVRQSLLDGNYITLTNLKDSDISRLIKYRISPVNISVHTLNPKLRQFMLGRRNYEDNCDNFLIYIKRLARAGIILNCQIVCCPGINDGLELKKTIEELIKLGPSLNSVSIVPVGLTNHRDGLYELKTYNMRSAREIVSLVEYYGLYCLKKRGKRIFFCSDEFYMTAKVAIPSNKFYEGYSQLSNGVGMMRLFMTQFFTALDNTICSNEDVGNNNIRSAEHRNFVKRRISIVTGTLAEPYIKKLINAIIIKYVNIGIANYLPDYKVYAVKNNFFGDSITVSGLITGTDIITQLKDKELGKYLIIPKNMLKFDENIFLDDISVDELSDALSVPVKVADTNGEDFLKALLEE